MILSDLLIAPRLLCQSAVGFAIFKLVFKLKNGAEMIFGVLKFKLKIDLD